MLNNYLLHIYGNKFIKIPATYIGINTGKKNQIEIFLKKKFLSKIDIDLII